MSADEASDYRCEWEWERLGFLGLHRIPGLHYGNENDFPLHLSYATTISIWVTETSRVQIEWELKGMWIAKA